MIHHYTPLLHYPNKIKLNKNKINIGKKYKDKEIRKRRRRQGRGEMNVVQGTWQQNPEDHNLM
jgi:hypothetical protein